MVGGEPKLVIGTAESKIVQLLYVAGGLVLNKRIHPIKGGVEKR